MRYLSAWLRFHPQKGMTPGEDQSMLLVDPGDGFAEPGAGTVQLISHQEGLGALFLNYFLGRLIRDELWSVWLQHENDRSTCLSVSSS